MIPKDPWIGARIEGRYLIERIIGSGGMGVVYEAIHESLKKRMAIKVLRPELAKNESVVKRFMREAQTASSIGHVNIANVTDFGYLPDGAPYFVMEYLEGESLADRIDRGPLSIDEALVFTDQIAAALTAAHAHEIVHRDLKPDNVFLAGRPGETPVVKLLDFGIAKAGGELARITQTGTLFGTPHYMSPEQAAGQNVDKRTDVYALGVIVYEMLTGALPFDADTFLGVLAKHMFEPPRPLAMSDERLGPLEPALSNALAKRPDERTPDAQTLAQALRAAASRMSATDRAATTLPPTSITTSVGVPKLPKPKVHASVPPPPRGLQRVALGVMVFGALAVTAFVIWKNLSAADVTTETTEIRPVQTTANAPPPAPEEDGAASRMVRITSSPAGALVTIEGAIVGHTPVVIPRPTRRVEATLELDGHERRNAALSELVASEVAFALVPIREPSATTSMRPSIAARPPPNDEPVRTSVQVAEPVMAPVRASMTELVDPWR